MSDALRIILASALLEFRHFARGRVFLFCTLLAAMNFLIGVSLFGLTGSRAPAALINNDGGPYADDLIQALNEAHHSFALRRMSAAEAEAALRSGRIVAAITIPAGFTRNVAGLEEVTLGLRIDNVNVDLTDDVQRALPSAIAAFARKEALPNIRVRVDEHDLLRSDTDYIPYLIVSSLALDALVISGILGAVVVAREWEGRALQTWKLWRLAPASPAAVLAGKLLAAAGLAAIAIAVTALVVVAGYRVIPVDPLAAAGTLLVCVVIFTSLGGLLGAIVRRTQVAVPLVFGLAMPFYLNSGALEPARFDGELIWSLAHISPVYYAIGVLEKAYHSLQVTPESVTVDLLALAACAAMSLLAARVALLKGGAR